MSIINYLLRTIAVTVLLTQSCVQGVSLPLQQRSYEAELLTKAKSMLNSSANGTHGHRLPICVDHPTWTGQGIRNRDCEVVIKALYDRYKNFFWRYYQFASPHAIPRKIGPEEVIRTPIKVSYETCTAAIVMMVEDIDMPSRPPWVWYSTDIATFDEVWVAANSIHNWCADREGNPGWTSVGMKSSVGITLWTTGSTEDQRVRNWDGFTLPTPSKVDRSKT